MKTVVIVGTGALNVAVSDLLNPKQMKLVGLADPNPDVWNVLDEKGEVRETIEGMPVMPVELAPSLQPDVILIASLDPTFCDNMRYLVIRAGFDGDILFLRDLAATCSVRGAVLRRLTRRLDALGVPGAVAELGCFRGDTSWQLNALLPERKLYLFDTFRGFDQRDIAMEQENGCSEAKEGSFGPVRPEKLMERLPAQEQVVLRQGWFPETAFELEDEKFALVYLDASLYQPTLAGLEFFFPRMSPGGMIVVPGTLSEQYRGVQAELTAFEQKYGAFLIVPLGDLDGTVVLVHP